MGEITVSVSGMRPVPWGCNEWAWRGTIAAKARSMRSLLGHDLGASTVYQVRITFRMNVVNIEHADLDNLAKPVFDTLFLPRNAQVTDRTLTGALFDVDDDRVFNLSLEKLLVPSGPEEGVDIHVSWQ